MINSPALPVMRSALALLLIGLFARPSAAARGETVQFWSAFSGGQPRTALERFVTDFNRRHAGAGRVVMLSLDYPQLEQKLVTAVAGNVPPDLALFNRPMVARYAFRGAFAPFDPYLPALGVNADDFFPHTWREGLWDGRQYCLPMNTDIRVLFYNRRLFREAGLDPDRPPRTWDELRTMSRRLTRRDATGRFLQVGFVPIGGPFGNTYFNLFAYQLADPLQDASGRLVVNGPGAVAAMQWILDFSRDYGIEKLMIAQTAAGMDELSLFLRERTAMEGNEGYLLSLIRRYRPNLDFGMAPLPGPKPGPAATWSGGFGFVLPRGKIPSPLCLEFLKYLSSRPVQLEFGKISGQIPALKAAAQDPFFMNDPCQRVFIEQMPLTRSLPVSPLSQKYFNDAIRAVEQVTYGRQTPRQALDELQRELDKEWESLTAFERNPVFPWNAMLLVAAGLLGALVLARAVVSWRRLRQIRLRRAEAFWGYLMAAPALAGLLGLTLGPIVLSILVSFCNYDVFNPPRWAGAENFRQMLKSDPLLYRSLWNTFFYTVFSVPLGVALALVLAVLLNQRLWLRALWRTLFYMPSIFPVVAGSFLWLWLFNGDFGLINRLLRLAGVSAVPWVTDPHWAKPALIVMSLWGIGASVVIFLAALQSVPAHLYESAQIDGATPLQQFRHITVPMVSPTIFFLTVVGTIGSFQVFTQAYLMTKGGPLDATTFYVLYLFRQAFEYFHMGYASAMAWLLCLVIGLLTFIQFRLGRRLVNYDAS